MSDDLALTLGFMEGIYRDVIDPDIRTDANESFQERVRLFSSESGKPAKSIMFTGYLYSPLRQFTSLLPSNIPLIFSFIKANDNRLLDWNGLSDIKDKKFQITIEDFELHILR